MTSCFERRRYTAVCAVFGAGLIAGGGADAASVTFFRDAGAAPTDIADTVDGFRAALGDLNPPSPENFADGRRQINWDAAPDGVSDPNAFPGDFFNFPTAPRARGIEFVDTILFDLAPEAALLGFAPATGFQLSSTAASGEPVEFGLDPQFQTFSAERLFAPTGGTVFDILFFDPADPDAPATTDGFGAVFTNVGDGELEDDATGETSNAGLLFFGAGGGLLGAATAPSGATGGLSFVGASFDDDVLARVIVFAGLAPIDATGAPGAAVALDDFIFGEPIPQPVPLPASALLLLTGLASLRLAARRRRG